MPRSRKSEEPPPPLQVKALTQRATKKPRAIHQLVDKDKDENNIYTIESPTKEAVVRSGRKIVITKPPVLPTTQTSTSPKPFKPANPPRKITITKPPPPQPSSLKLPKPPRKIIITKPTTLPVPHLSPPPRSITTSKLADISLEKLADMTHELLKNLEKHKLKNYDSKKVAEIESMLYDIRKEFLHRQAPSTNLSLAHLYPEVDNANFSLQIAQKKEFGSHKYDRVNTSKNPNFYEEQVDSRCGRGSRFELTKNQKFIKNFMSPHSGYNSILLFHSVGVGKTCSAITIAEQFREVFQRKALVLLPTNLKDNFRRQIFDITKIDRRDMDATNQCVAQSYLHQVNDRHLISNDVLEKRVNQLIKDNYQFYGFQEFANIIARMEDNIRRLEPRPESAEVKLNAALKEAYSNRVIIIDEAHNMRAENEQTAKKVPPLVMKVLRAATNVKLVLLTATPMYNDSREIVWLLNLVMANEKKPQITEQQVFDATGAMHPKGRQFLATITRGYVSFMRGQNPFSFPMRLTPTINKDTKIFSVDELPKTDIYGVTLVQKDKISHDLTLIKASMSDYQSNIYKEVERAALFTGEGEDIESDNDNEDEENTTKSISKPVQISNIVYPSDTDMHNTTYGKSGFMNCFDKVTASKQFRVTYKPHVKAKYGEFLNIDNISNYSAKLNNIVDYILQSDGVVFVYSYYLYGGILPLAIALEHAGFNKRGGNNILASSESRGAPGAKFTYSILTGDAAITPDLAMDIEIARSSNNQDGSIVKVILGSNVTSEGIDFKCIREVHILEPWHHLNRLEQVIGRAVRTCSHVSLPKEKRNTTVYFHAAVPNYYFKNDLRESIDLRMYRTSTTKQAYIRDVEDVLKSNAIDCIMNSDVSYFDPNALNIKHDIHTSQGIVVKGFKIGDHPEFSSYKAVKCASTNALHNATLQIGSDTSTFHHTFFQDDIHLYIQYIAQQYKDYVQTFTFEELETKVSKQIGGTFDADILKFALEHIVSQKHVVRNSSIGIVGYIVYRGNTYTLVPLDEPFSYITHQRRSNYKALKTRRIKLDTSRENHNLNHDKDALRDNAVGPQRSSISNRLTLIPTIGAQMKTLKDRMYPSMQIDKAKSIIPVMIDFLIDRLEEHPLVQLAQEILFTFARTSPTMDSLLSEIRASFVRGGILVETETTTYFRTPYSTSIVYIVDTANKVLKKCSPDDFSQCSPIDYNNYSRCLDPTKEFIKVKTSIKMFKAYIDVSKGKPAFKIVGDKEHSDGFVCHQTSPYSVAHARADIEAIDANILQHHTKSSKPTLCEVYEIVLREHQPDMIARPYVSSLLKSMKSNQLAIAKLAKTDKPTRKVAKI